MPKELTHWWLAAEAVRRHPPDRSTSRLLEEYRCAYLAGAILPDTLLHLLLGSYKDKALQLSDSFHDTGTNSYDPLIHFASQLPAVGAPADALSAPLTACLLGVASHMEADIVFHPFVYAQAGSDLRQHYRIETALDLWLLHSGHKPPVWQLRELLEKESDRTAVLTVLGGVFDPGHTLTDKALAKSLGMHARIQAMYSKPAWRLLAQLLGVIPGAPFRRWSALFYPADWRAGRAASWPERWKHPSTNVERGDTPEGLLNDAVMRISRLLHNVDRFGLTAALQRQTGENLLTGQAPPSG